MAEEDHVLIALALRYKVPALAALDVVIVPSTFKFPVTYAPPTTCNAEAGDTPMPIDAELNIPVTLAAPLTESGVLGFFVPIPTLLFDASTKKVVVSTVTFPVTVKLVRDPRPVKLEFVIPDGKVSPVINDECIADAVPACVAATALEDITALEDMVADAALLLVAGSFEAKSDTRLVMAD